MVMGKEVGRGSRTKYCGPAEALKVEKINGTLIFVLNLLKVDER